MSFVTKHSSFFNIFLVSVYKR